MRGRVAVDVAIVVPLALAGAAGASSPTNAQLRLMPLTKAGHGQAAAALQPDSVRCYGNAEAAKADLVRITRARLGALGRVNGCTAAFELDDNRWRPGVPLGAATGATLFRSETGTRRYLALEASTVRGLAAVADRRIRAVLAGRIHDRK